MEETAFGTVDVDIFSLDISDEEQFTDDAEVIGQSSTFHDTFGYHADGVGRLTALMPTDWQSRAEKMDIPGAQGAVLWVPDVNDVALAKMCAWRDKDREWLEAAIRDKVIAVGAMRSRLADIVQTDHTPSLSELSRRLDWLEPPK
ncbi:MAG: DUF6036 family nucleotidyltransferase [Rhizobiaceae bacterium]